MSFDRSLLPAYYGFIAHLMSAYSLFCTKVKQDGLNDWNSSL